MQRNRIIKVDALARVEGEGAMYIRVRNGEIVDVKLNIYEPPRFFEAFLRGRKFIEAPDITARICGICPVAYQMSSIHAIENALGIKINGQLRALRRLIYCGEWIESHVLHIYLLHMPDFLGYESAVHMAKDYPEIVKNGLELKKIGNEILKILGGRAVHPINIRVGGFYKIPTKRELEPLIEKLEWGVKLSLDTIHFVSKFNFPDFEQDYEFVALSHPDEYPFNEGRLISNKGLDISINEYDNNFVEEQVPHSNALHSIIKQRGAYFVGPMARYNLNFDKLSQRAKEVAEKVGIRHECRNPFKSIIIRSIETLYACEEALRIIREYEQPKESFVNVIPKPDIGYGCTEAPRGILYHRYKIDNDGIIQDAKIVPPTSQNQKVIENDLYYFVKKYLDLSTDSLTLQCEQLIRNYDPCISCATHFLKLHIETE